MANKKDRIGELETLIRRYQKSYYNGEAEISDQDFDDLWDELRSLDPKNTLFTQVGPDSIDGFPKVAHLIPMGSQEKAANPEEFYAWARKTSCEAFVVQHKLDGASLELQYQEGQLLRAVSRGDGFIGDDITPNARRMKGVLETLDVPFTGGVRGEVLMPRDVWQAKYGDKANCRNAANGIMRRKDGLGCEDLQLICYDASAKGVDTYFPDEVTKIAWLRDRGFSVTPTEVLREASAVVEYRRRIMENRFSLPYDIDGLVVKDLKTDMEDLRKARPERQIAFKFELESAVTTLRAVEWSESGATYTPIALVDPVRLAGTTVQRANLNNPDMIRSLDLRIGSRVIIVKRGEIIPKIEGLAPQKPGEGQEGLQSIPVPSTCTTCGSTLVDGGTRLYCPNPACAKRILHRLDKWVTVLDIRELGDKLLRRLYESGRLRRVADLYTLNAEELQAVERMGPLSAAKVVKHIRTPRTLPLATFVAGFDFEGVGETIMEKVAAAGFDTLDKLRSASVGDLASVFGLGDITAATIVDGLTETRSDMDAVLATGIIRIAEPPSPDTQILRPFSFCFTGELRTLKRSEAENRVRELGGQAKASVVKDLSFLVTNDPSSGSAKNVKARELGVTIIDEEAFLKLLANPALAQELRPAASKGVKKSSSPSQGELFGAEETP
jgi:DNA ligase (NAD+)